MLSRQAVARRGRRTPTCRGGLCIRRWVRPRQRLLAYSGVQRPGTLAVQHRRPSQPRSSCTGLSWAGRFSHSTAERRLPWADPLRRAEAELAVFAGFTQAYWSTPQHESHRRQGRRSSLTKINKEAISRGGAAANMHGDRRARSETRPPAFLAMP